MKHYSGSLAYKILFLISSIIPFVGGIIFVDSAINYYKIRKCLDHYESIFNLCAVINEYYYLIIVLSGLFFNFTAILLYKLKKIHQLTYMQVNFLYFGLYPFLFNHYFNSPYLIVLLAIGLFMLIGYFMVNQKYYINKFKFMLLVIFVLSIAYPFTRGFKDLIYYYFEDKWAGPLDFATDNSGKDVWSNDIQLLLIGVNQLNLNEFSSEGFSHTFVDVAAWPIQHKDKSRWIVYKGSDNHKECILKWESSGIYISYC